MSTASDPPDQPGPPDQPDPPDRLEAVLSGIADAGAELAELDALVRRLRSADPAGDVTIDPQASWRRLESLLDSRPDHPGS